MKGLLYFCRIFVGSLFVVSGIIKANDPKGFSYKLQEYFAESALNLPFLEDYALILGVLACLAEIVLGFAVIFGGKMKLTTWLLLILTVFFAWLTLYTATCNESDTYMTMINGVSEERPVTCVTDCGCFGDAMKGSLGRSLTPWESFYKDLILGIFLLPIFFSRSKISLNTIEQDRVLLPGSLIFIALLSWVFGWYFPVIFALVCFAGYLLIKRLKDNADWTIAAMVALLAILFTWYCNQYLPARDYRPYAVDMSIPEGMKTAEELGLKAPVYATDYLLKNKQSGEEKVFRSDVYSSQKLYQDWDFVEAQGESYKVADGYEPLITDFRIEDEQGSDVNDILLDNDKPVLMVISYDVTKADNAAMKEIGKLTADWEKQGGAIFGISSSPTNEVEISRHENQLAFPVFIGDGKVLKTVVRSNPGLVLMKKGMVLGKWPNTSIPDMEEVNSLLK